jgi:2-polyprenyl-3-methyl-5-hydroxy-6-metoxy-1,4-benzoquinol methylase
MEVVEKIMEKSPYKHVNRKFVEKLAGLIKSDIEEEKVKLVRAKLRKISTSALSMKFYKKFKTLEFSKEVLDMHRSTRERADIYSWLISKIEKSGKIIDLGCGFNLLAFYYNEFLPAEYKGYDIDEAVIQFVNRFAHEKKLNAEVESRDVSEIDFEEADVCLCLKIFDALEDVEKNVAKTILGKMSKKTKLIIASFSNISLSGRGQLRERTWFEKMLTELGLKFTKESKGNEIFYFIEC